MQEIIREGPIYRARALFEEQLQAYKRSILGTVGKNCQTLSRQGAYGNETRLSILLCDHLPQPLSSPSMLLSERWRLDVNGKFSQGGQ